MSQLAQLPHLNELLLIGNPCYGNKDREDYLEINATKVLSRVPQVQHLDGLVVSAGGR